jgi:hypothetical protein
MLRLKKSQIEEFYDAGYVVLPGVFRDAEIREIGEAFDRLRDTAIKLTRPRMIKGSYFVVEDHRINRIVWCGAVRRGRAAHVPVEPAPGNERNGAAHLPGPL